MELYPSTLGTGKALISGTPAANQVAFWSSTTAITGDAGITYTTTSGLVLNEAGGSSIDARMESGSYPNMFFLDASSNSVNLTDAPFGGTLNDTPTGGWITGTNLRIDNRSDISDNAYLAIMSGASGQGAIHFGDSDDQDRSAITVSHGATPENMTFTVATNSALQLSTTEVIVNQNSYENMDFRCEGNNEEYLFFVDSSTDRVAIGHDTPLYKLHMEDDALANMSIDTYVTSVQGADIYLNSARGSAASPAATNSGDQLGNVYFGGYDDAGIEAGKAGIRAVATETWDASGHGCKMQFSTTTDNSTTRTTRMTIGENGRVQVGSDEEFIESADFSVTAIGGLMAVARANAADSGPGIDFYKARGSITSPTAVQSGDTLGSVQFRGYDDAGWETTRAAVQALATQNWTATNQGSKLRFTVTPDNTVVYTAVMEIQGTGGVIIGNTDAINNGPNDAELNLNCDGARNNDLHLFRCRTAANPTSTLKMLGARGTMASPTATQSGDLVGQIGFGGYDDAGWEYNKADIRAYATENWTASAHGMRLELRVTPTGTATSPIIMTLKDKYVAIGDNTPTRPLHIQGDWGAVPTLALHNESAADGRCTIEFTADSSSTGVWVIGMDPTGGTTKDFYFRDSTNTVNAMRIKDSVCKVSIGGDGVDPAEQLTINTPTDIGDSVLGLQQDDDNEPFISFDGTTEAGASKSISSWQGGNQIQGFVRQDVNGTDYWMPYFDAPTQAGSQLDLSIGTISCSNGDNDDVTHPGAGIAVVSGPSDAFTISGITGGANGQILTILNLTGFNLTMEHENAGSTAANRLTNMTGGDIVSTGNCCYTYVYYNSRWNFMCGSS